MELIQILGIVCAGLSIVLALLVFLLPSLRAKKDITKIELIFKGIISIIVLVAALYIILSQNYPEEYNKWAFSAIALILGVWVGTLT